MTPTPAPRDERKTPEFLTPELREVGAEAVRRAVEDQCYGVETQKIVYAEAVMLRVARDADEIIEEWKQRAALAESELAEVRANSGDPAGSFDKHMEYMRRCEQLTRDNDELRAKVAELEADEPAWDAMMTKLEDDNTELRAELERVKKDAARYRYIRRPNDLTILKVVERRENGGICGTHLQFVEELDAAIDAAIDASRGGEGGGV